jgi:hypothetical protein
MSLGSQTDLSGMLGSGAAPGFPAPEWSWNDDLTVSLLQARLTELNLPINVAIGGPLGSSV